MPHSTEIYETKYRGPAGQQNQLALWHQEVLKVLSPLDKSQQILEVGCGNGRLLARIAELGFDALGIDVSSEAVNRCREKDLQARQVDVSVGIPYEGKFDICVSVEVIEHVFDPYHFLGQLNKCLKPRGKAIVTTPNFGYYRWQWRYLRGESPSQIQNPLHVRFFTAAYLDRTVKLQGFRILRLYSPVKRFQWVEVSFEKLGLRAHWETITRRWGKTLFAVLKKTTSPQYDTLAQARRSGDK